jgi:hypothetical protein
VLNGTLALNGIHDVEAFCIYILKRLKLTPHEHEDALAYLIEETWILSTHHKPGAGTFPAHAATRLPQRLIDWQRKRKDTRYPSNTRYTTIHTDDPTIRRQLERTHTNPSHNDPPDRNTDQLVRLLRTRSRSRPRNNHKTHPRTTTDPP